MMSSFSDICVLILCCNDVRRDIKLVEGVGKKRFCELVVVVPT